MRGRIRTLGIIAAWSLCAGATPAAETTQRYEKADLRVLIEILETDFLPE